MGSTDEQLTAPSPSPVETTEQTPTTAPDAPATPAAEATPPAAPNLEQITEALAAGRFPDEPAPAAEPATSPEPVPAVVDPVKAVETDGASKPADPDTVYDAEGDLTPADIDPKFTKIRERVEKQQANLREARKEAQFSRMLKDVAESGNLQPNDVAWLLTTAAAANVGDPAAQAELAALVQRQGWAKALPPAPATTPAAPAVDPAQALKVRADEVYQTKFKAKVDAMKMDEDVARELATELATTALSQQQTPPPAPSAPAAQAPQQRVPATVDQMLAQAANQEMDRIDAAMQKSIPPERWKQVFAKANELVAADRKAGKFNPNPVTWVADWQAKLREAQIALNPAPAKPPAAGNSMRPSTGASQPGAAKSGREASLAAVAEALRRGDLDSLPY